ncbi:MAG: hypothetical protein KDH19_00055 [Geminicoccaceae bacterium]|nr:hypothetical protein [Geminicoccaceae bacterium]
MTWLAAALLCILVVEIALRLPFAGLLRRTARTATSALWTLRARHVSDHWKEKVMVAYSGRMFACSLGLALWLLVVAAVVIAFVLAVEFVLPGFSAFMTGWQGIVASLVAASIYLSLRKHLPHARLQSARQAASPAGPATRSGR